MSYITNMSGQATGTIAQRLHRMALYPGNEKFVVRASKPNTRTIATSVSGHLNNDFRVNS